MCLSGNNTFNGDLTVNAGTLTLASATAYGASGVGGSIFVISNATLAVDASISFSRYLYLNGSGTPSLDVVSGNSTWVSVFEVLKDSVVNVNPSASLRTGNLIVGRGRLTKTGGGLLTLAGSTSNLNTNGVVVNEGTLVLTNSGFNQNIVGPLIIGDGVGGADADVVRLDRVRQIANTVPVTINSSGLLDLNGLSDAFGALSGNGHVDLNGGILEANYPDATSVFDGIIRGAGDFYKDGTGTLTLNGNNTYTGTTVLYADAATPGGTLLVNGSQPQSSVAVSNGCTLGGSGRVGAITVAVGGTVAPGASTGILTCGDVAFTAGTIFRVELAGPAPGTGHDQLNVFGAVSLGGAALDLTVGFAPEPGQSFVILNNDATDLVSGTFAGLANGATLSAGGFTFRIRYNGGTGNDIVLTDTRPPAPLIPFGSVWKYLDNGSDQGTAWRELAFDDNAWGSGPAQLGYGDGDEATVVSFGPNAGNKYTTTYFRRAFTIASPADFECLLLRLVRDDGVTVYLNGVEVLRDNLPSGTISNGTFATTFLAAPYETNLFLSGIASASLVAGTNVLAAEIHQSDSFSSDISFDLELSSSLSGGPACIKRRVWIGTAGGGMNNIRWTRSADWTPSGAPLAGDILRFPADAIQLTNLNDFAAGTRFHSIEIGGANYRLQGAGILLEAGISDAPDLVGTGTNVIEFPLTLAADQSVSLPFSTSLLQLGDIITAGHTLKWESAAGTIVGGLSGAGGLAQVGGSLRLAGTNTHTGPTTVGAGSLTLDGAVTASTLIMTNGFLYGTGRVHALQCPGGIVGPGGASVAGTLTASNATFGPAATLRFILANTNGGHSRLAVFGPVHLGGARLTPAPQAGFTPVPDHVTRLIDNNGADPVQGTFDGLPEGATVVIAGLQHFISYQAGDGNDVELKVVNPVVFPLNAAVASGNGNAVLEPNECGQINLVMTNSAADTTTGIEVTLLSDTSGITITQPISGYPDMPSASRRTNTTPFQISVSPGFTCGATANLRARVRTANHGTYFVPVTLAAAQTNVSSIPLRFNDSGMTSNIVPGQTLRRFFNVSGVTGALGRVELSMHCFGTANQNLDIFLVSPGGTRVELSTDNGGGSDAYGNSCEDADRTRFSDSASVSITSGTFTSFPSGTYRPEGSLAAFAGRSGGAVNGTWTLEVTHDTFSTTDVNGRFRCSSLFLHPFECAPGTGACELCPDGAIAGAVSGFGYSTLIATNGIASACSAPKPCPGMQATVSVGHEIHVFHGGQTNACITATLTALSGTLDLVIYTNTFNPANLCANYFADAGLRASNPGTPRACSFNISYNQAFFVVISGTAGSYTLAMSGGDCRPRMNVIPAAGNNLVLDWTTAAPGYLLECTNRIPFGPANWPPVTNLPGVVNSRYQVTNSAAGSNLFYRLRRPAP